MLEAINYSYLMYNQGITMWRGAARQNYVLNKCLLFIFYYPDSFQVDCFTRFLYLFKDIKCHILFCFENSLKSIMQTMS